MSRNKKLLCVCFGILCFVVGMLLGVVINNHYNGVSKVETKQGVETTTTSTSKLTVDNADYIGNSNSMKFLIVGVTV